MLQNKLTNCSMDLMIIKNFSAKKNRKIIDSSKLVFMNNEKYSHTKNVERNEPVETRKESVSNQMADFETGKMF